MNRKDFILHLLGEVAQYLLEASPMRMVISLHQEKDGLHLAVLDDRVRGDEELASMQAALNRTHRPELAEYYGSMAGHDMLGSARLDLVGWQVKAGTVSRTPDGTKIDLWLGGSGFDPERSSVPGSREGKPRRTKKTKKVEKRRAAEDAE